MPSNRITIRLNEQESAMVEQLLATWSKRGKVATPTDVIRRAIRLAENHRRRSNRQPEIQETPGDVGGELRQGRPRKERSDA